MSAAVTAVERFVRQSKLVSYALRHRPDEFGLELDRAGWVTLDALVAALAAHADAPSRDELLAIVAASDKQRFALSADGTRIRANQGHSVAVDLELPVAVPPPVLYHGTVQRFLRAIRSGGLMRGKRQHVHLSATPELAAQVGRRRGAPIVLEVDARAMHEQGFVFFTSANGVWLTEHVPPRFLALSSAARAP